MNGVPVDYIYVQCVGRCCTIKAITYFQFGLDLHLVLVDLPRKLTSIC